jgi:ABC-type transport system substrate-binding protein
VANPGYYGDGPYLDSIILKFVPTENALLVQLKTGEIDMFDNANINFIGQLEQISGVRVYRTPMLMYEHLDLNTEHAALNDRRVRRALSFATNKREIAERVYNGWCARPRRVRGVAILSAAAARDLRPGSGATPCTRPAGDTDGDGLSIGAGNR